MYTWRTRAIRVMAIAVVTVCEVGVATLYLAPLGSLTGEPLPNDGHHLSVVLTAATEGWVRVRCAVLRAASTSSGLRSVGSVFVTAWLAADSAARISQ